jgi:alpha,alpha-trehalase
MESRKSIIEINPDDFDACIFDMDGVITDTADIHAAAWKRMFDDFLKQRARDNGEDYHPFDADSDYRRYVDGKVRYDGVRSFLESRGIILDYGNPEDKPGKETICGLGNRKNGYFLDSLKKRAVKAFDSSIEFINELKNNGVLVALISTSRNAEEVLQAAGIDGLFDTEVDGIDMDNLQLKDKPDPLIFREAALRLGVKPEKAAVIDDSLAGVEAGCLGRFKLVIGVDRYDQSEELRARGADIVVQDLSQLVLRKSSQDRSEQYPVIDDLPSALKKKNGILFQLREKTAVIFLDYDGTLTPIVETPEQAILTKQHRKALEYLTEHYTVAIISGRDLKDVQKMVGISNIAYAGSHGFDISGPGGKYRNEEIGMPYLDALDHAEKELNEKTADISGARVERKRFAIAVHYRQVQENDVETVIKRFDEVSAHHPELKKSTGKKVIELRPNVDWDKGKALTYMLDILFTDGTRILPFYIGDDITDEDAFEAIKEHGIPIVVGSGTRPTVAKYRLNDPDEVFTFLQEIAEFAEMEMPKNQWVMAYDKFIPEQEGLRESLCTLGNAYFATRGAAAESSADSVHYPGTYLAGLYNRLTDEIKGQVLENESLVNVPNWLPLSLKFGDGRWFNIMDANILEYRQELDMHQGVLSRLVRFSDENNRRTRIFQRRFVSMANDHFAGLETTIVAENWSGDVSVCSALDGTVTNSGIARYRSLSTNHLNPVETRIVSDDIIHLVVETNQSHIRIAEAARTRVFIGGKRVDVKAEYTERPGYIAQEFSIKLEEGKMATIEKIITLCTSRDRALSESGVESIKQIKRTSGFDELIAQHILRWDQLWKRCGIAIEDSSRVSMVLNLHIFHLLQTVSPHSIDLDVGVPPRGLHGEAYRGHILWDELFIFPFLNLRIPDLTRALLMYRYRRLNEARWIAKQAGYEGALYPWQSGSDGREESQLLHLNPRSGHWMPDNSQLQRHVNIAVAYNVWQYYQVSGDINFLSFYGAEMLVEIARFWASIAEYNHSLGRYEIKKVMGPDEFHDSYPGSKEPGINNNAYTNIMAVWVLCHTLEALDLTEMRRQNLVEKLSIKPEELERWRDISRKMRIVFHDNNVISQFEGYGELEEFDWEAYRKKYENIHRLDRILEAEGDSPNRYKLSKQADVLMLFYLLSADELEELFKGLNYPFDQDTIPRNIWYYSSRTSHGSTLSRVVHAWVLARSQRELSWHLFKEALESDVSDIQGGTTSEGIHLGAMAGTVDLVQRCYTGIETRENKLLLNPSLPHDLKGMQFDILYRQHWVNLQITSNKLIISTRKNALASIWIDFRGNTYELNAGDTMRFDL